MIVIKIGGSCLRYPRLLAQECKFISVVNEAVLIPGGGPFADLVRKMAEKFEMEDSESHWMALLAMNQFGYLLSRLVKDSKLFDTVEEIKAAPITRPVIWLPYQEMKGKDPLPHSWNVTSDSIAAWLTVQLGIKHFVKVTAFKGQLPPVITASDPFLQQIGLIDQYLSGYQDQFKLECHVLCLNTISSHADYYSGNRPPDMIIKPEVRK